MDQTQEIEKNIKLIKITSWIMIVISAILIIRSLFGIYLYSTILGLISSTESAKNVDTSRYIIYMIEMIIGLLLFTILIASSIYISQYKEKWRAKAKYLLILTIIYLIISTLIDNLIQPSSVVLQNSGTKNLVAKVDKTYSLLLNMIIPILLSFYFMYVIAKLSKAEIKLLFK